MRLKSKVYVLHYLVERGAVLLSVPVTGWNWIEAVPVQHL